jgi:hypothetical protein
MCVYVSMCPQTTRMSVYCFVSTDIVLLLHTFLVMHTYVHTCMCIHANMKYTFQQQEGVRTHMSIHMHTPKFQLVRIPNSPEVTSTRIYIHMSIHTHTCDTKLLKLQAFMDTYVNSRTYMTQQSSTYKHEFIHTYIHTYVNSRMYDTDFLKLHAFIHTYTHAYTRQLAHIRNHPQHAQQV